MYVRYILSEDIDPWDRWDTVSMNARTLVLMVMAVAIAILLVVMVKSRTDSSAVSTGPRILVASADIPVGSFLRSEKNIGWKEWPKGEISPQFFQEEGHKVEEYNGGVARRDIVAGEPITSGSIVKANDGGFMSAVLTAGKRAVSIAVSATSGNAGFIFPGDRVDLILTHRMPGDMLASETFIEDVRVLAIDQMLNNPENKAMVAKTITLEVSPKQAEMVNVASNIGNISVSLRSLANNTPANENNATPNPNAPTAGSYSTNEDVSRLMGESANKVNVYHGTSNEQMNFQEPKK